MQRQEEDKEIVNIFITGITTVHGVDTTRTIDAFGHCLVVEDFVRSLLE